MNAVTWALLEVKATNFLLIPVLSDGLQFAYRQSVDPGARMPNKMSATTNERTGTFQLTLRYAPEFVISTELAAGGVSTLKISHIPLDWVKLDLIT